LENRTKGGERDSSNKREKKVDSEVRKGDRGKCKK